MDWKRLIRELQQQMTQREIADACNTGQSHISALARGVRLAPSWELGNKLITLHSERCEKVAA
jgi:transcriptional regulator with XRE-family HTH domain